MEKKQEDTTVETKKETKKAASKKQAKKTLAKADKSLDEIKKEVVAPKEIKQSSEYKLPTGKYYYATGKRKTSIARVRLYKGDGSIFVNEKPVNKYFQTKLQAELLKSPVKLTGMTDRFTITVKVSGGGTYSQADAIRHGIARALVLSDATLRHTLKQAGFLTRDPRIKERKKFGLRGARRGRQFSKR